MSKVLSKSKVWNVEKVIALVLVMRPLDINKGIIEVKWVLNN